MNAPAFAAHPLPGSTYTDDWGNGRSGGRTHQGLDMFAPEGTPIVAPWAGRVDAVRYGYAGLGGLRLWIVHETGWGVYMAHCSRLVALRGTMVQPGTTVALVGKTGNAATTPPHLHLGVATPAGVWVPPLPLVRAAPRIPGAAGGSAPAAAGTTSLPPTGGLGALDWQRTAAGLAGVGAIALGLYVMQGRAAATIAPDLARQLLDG